MFSMNGRLCRRWRRSRTGQVSTSAMLCPEPALGDPARPGKWGRVEWSNTRSIEPSWSGPRSQNRPGVIPTTACARGWTSAGLAGKWAFEYGRKGEIASPLEQGSIMMASACRRQTSWMVALCAIVGVMLFAGGASACSSEETTPPKLECCVSRPVSDCGCCDAPRSVLPTTGLTSVRAIAMPERVGIVRDADIPGGSCVCRLSGPASPASRVEPPSGNRRTESCGKVVTAFLSIPRPSFTREPLTAPSSRALGPPILLRTARLLF